MKTILCTLLAILLCSTGFAADKAQPAAYVTASSLVEIGKTYHFSYAGGWFGGKVIKRFNENWIQIDDGTTVFPLNLQAIICILPVKTEQPKPSKP